MAEQEIAKHTKKVVRLFEKSEHGWRHKLGEMTLEIVTIVFAVTLSIWLHGLGEHRHEQEQVRHFLLGLKHDLGADIDYINELNTAYRGYDANFEYLSKLDPRSAPDPEKFEKAYQAADSNYFFSPQTSRYQGFKSSGKLIHIEDEALLEKILNLYELQAEQIKTSEAGWRNRQNTFRAYVESSLTGDDSIEQHYQLVTAPKGKRLLRKQIAMPQLYDRYANYARLGAEIIKEIEQKYPDAAHEK